MTCSVHSILCLSSIMFCVFWTYIRGWCRWGFLEHMQKPKGRLFDAEYSATCSKDTRWCPPETGSLARQLLMIPTQQWGWCEPTGEAERTHSLSCRTRRLPERFDAKEIAIRRGKRASARLVDGQTLKNNNNNNMYAPALRTESLTKEGVSFKVAEVLCFD